LPLQPDRRLPMNPKSNRDKSLIGWQSGHCGDRNSYRDFRAVWTFLRDRFWSFCAFFNSSLAACIETPSKICYSLLEEIENIWLFKYFNYLYCSDNSKPSERMGRKAIGAKLRLSEACLPVAENNAQSLYGGHFPFSGILSDNRKSVPFLLQKATHRPFLLGRVLSVGHAGGKYYGDITQI